MYVSSFLYRFPWKLKQQSRYLTKKNRQFWLKWKTRENWKVKASFLKYQNKWIHIRPSDFENNLLVNREKGHKKQTLSNHKMTDDDTHTDKTVESRKIWVRRMTLILYVIGLQLKHLLRHMPFWKIFYRMKRESCSFFMLR